MARRTKPLPKIQCQVCGDGTLQRLQVYRHGRFAGVLGQIFFWLSVLSFVIYFLFAMAAAGGAGEATSSAEEEAGVIALVFIMFAIPMAGSVFWMLVGHLLRRKKWMLKCGDCTATVAAA
jgi:TRAP-type mannitol/chloroaromatic compound transport system permease small subunit